MDSLVSHPLIPANKIISQIDKVRSTCLSIPQLEFIAQNELVTIIPNFKMPKIPLLGGPLGPFTPNLSIDVPLWLGLSLRKKGKCNIIPPSWMEFDTLKKVVQQQKSSQGFTQLPFYWLEISHLICKYATDDIPRISLVQTLLDELYNIRRLRSESALSSIGPKTTVLNLSSLSHCELNSMRPLLIETLSQYQVIRHSGNQASIRKYQDATEVSSILRTSKTGPRHFISSRHTPSSEMTPQMSRYLQRESSLIKTPSQLPSEINLNESITPSQLNESILEDVFGDISSKAPDSADPSVASQTTSVVDATPVNYQDFGFLDSFSFDTSKLSEESGTNTGNELHEPDQEEDPRERVLLSNNPTESPSLISSAGVAASDEDDDDELGLFSWDSSSPSLKHSQTHNNKSQKS